MKTNIKILIADDSSTHNLLCRSMFEDCGYNVIATEDSSTVEDLVQQNRPDVVLLDIMMPGTDGYTILQRLKKNKSTRQIPVIVVSSKDTRKDMDIAMQLGAVGYVKKPIGINNLVGKVEKIIGVAN